MEKLNSYSLFQHTATLKELSKDTSVTPVEFMTESTVVAADFDKAKAVFQQNLGLSEDGHARSVDALLQSNERLYFIEFKNGHMKGEKVGVKEKLRDSLLIYCETTQHTVAYTREYAEFILVYNEKKNPLPNQYTKNGTQPSPSRNFITKQIAQLGKREIVLFDLERFKTLYFRDVHTYTQAEFENFLSKIETRQLAAL